MELLHKPNRFEPGQSPKLGRVVEMAGIFCAPASHPSAQRLDALVLKAWPILEAAESALSSPATLADDIERLFQNAKSINAEYSWWPENQPVDWKPRTIGYVNPKQVRLPQGLSCFPERIDVYLDCEFVAAFLINYLLMTQYMSLQFGARTARLAS